MSTPKACSPNPPSLATLLSLKWINGKRVKEDLNAQNWTALDKVHFLTLTVKSVGVALLLQLVV